MNQNCADPDLLLVSVSGIYSSSYDIWWRNKLWYNLVSAAAAR